MTKQRQLHSATSISAIAPHTTALLLLMLTSTGNAAIIEITFSGFVATADTFTLDWVDGDIDNYGFFENQRFNGSITIDSSLAGENLSSSVNNNTYRGTQTDWIDYSVTIGDNTFSSTGGGRPDFFSSTSGGTGDNPEYSSLTIQANDANNEFSIDIEDLRDLWLPAPLTPESEITIAPGDIDYSPWATYTFSDDISSYLLSFQVDNLNMVNTELSAVPLPPSLLLFISGLLGILGLKRKKT